MKEYPLTFKNGHLFVELQGGLWVYDTGAPTSFGETQELRFGGETFPVAENFMGLSADELSGYIGIECAGLLGADVINDFDHILDLPRETLIVSKENLQVDGGRVPITDSVMGIPIVTARIAGSDYRMFFDTGAQFSFFQDDSIRDFPETGKVTDFYPGAGPFETDTHQVDLSLSDLTFTLRCGTLPGLLGQTLMVADSQGIVGNESMKDRITGYFPRRNDIYFS
jgi:hypothetical protein